MNTFPKVSVIVPTFNEENNIKKCLDSIFRQTYPHNKIEVIVVDDSSTDRTVKIAAKHPVTIITHNNKHGEIGKMIGFRKATGKYAIYIDADIELRGNNWFQQMIRPLEEDGEIVGSFTRYYSRRDDSPLERYYSFDPLQRDTIYQLFSSSIGDVVKKNKDGYKLLEYKRDKIPPAGLVLYRKNKLLEVVKGYKMFLELDFLVLLTKKGFNKFAYVSSAGLYHHHATSLKQLIRKRRYNVKNVYLKTMDNKLYKWFDLKNYKDIIKIISWIIYANLFIPSIFVGLYKSIKYKDWAGMYEPLVNLLVTNIVMLSFLCDTRTINLVDNKKQ